jgi:hypothetical protein
MGGMSAGGGVVENVKGASLSEVMPVALVLLPPLLSLQSTAYLPVGRRDKTSMFHRKRVREKKP